MAITGSHISQISSLPPETVQTYLDALATISAKFGIVIDCGSLRPMDDDVGGYLLTTGGYLRLYSIGDRVADVVRDNLRGDGPAQWDPHTMVSDIAGLSAHDLIRFIRKL